MQEQIYGYHIHDSRRIREKIQKKIINVTITSPPYWKLKNYESKLQIGFGQVYDDYLEDLTNIFAEIYEITRDNGSLWVVMDTLKQKKELKLLPFDFATRLKEIGWKLQDIIIWVKDKNLPWSHKGKLRNIFEYILFFTKNDNFKFYIDRIKEPKKLQNWWIKYPERYNPKGKAPERLWYFPIPTQGSWGNGWIRHFCPFPPKMVERIILLTTNKNDIVLDPFAGSGVVLAQAKVMGRKAIGFDINHSYKNMYINKVYPFIKSNWKKRKDELVERQRKSAQFSYKIKSLRQLKYPKTLVKIAIKKGILNLPSINFVFLIGNIKSMSPKIYLILEDNFNLSNLHSKIESITSQPPLSKFGLTPEIEIVNQGKFKDICKKYFPQSFYIYEDGNTHYYRRKIHLSEWIKQNKNVSLRQLPKIKFPPILSNLHERVSFKEKAELKHEK